MKQVRTTHLRPSPCLWLLKPATAVQNVSIQKSRKTGIQKIAASHHFSSLNLQNSYKLIASLAPQLNELPP